MIFKVPKVPFLGFLSNAQNFVKENICPDYFPESSIIVILLLKMFVIKNLTDFHKTVETGVDPRLCPSFLDEPREETLATQASFSQADTTVKNCKNIKFAYWPIHQLPFYTKINLLLCFASRALRLSGKQRAKKVVSDSPGLVDFAIGPVNSVFNLPDGQVMFFEEFE